MRCLPGCVAASGDWIYLPSAGGIRAEEAAAFYESRMEGLGRSFINEVGRTISLAREFPDAGAFLGASLRRVSVAGFPYSIVYRANADIIVIVAVAHQRRRPGYWRDRS